MPWEVTETEIRNPIKPASDFEEGSFRSKDLGNGIRLILGKPKGSTEMVAQSIRFDLQKWDLAKARQWFMEHKGQFGKKIEPSKDGLFSLKNVEIFSAGVWNGDKYTIEDLDAMVEAFDENKKGFTPPLKLGHDESQKILQADGLPAAGYVERLFRKGSRLLADFIDVPSKIAALIEKKAYKKVSSEIYWDIPVNGKTFKRMLGGVALLGGDVPGVLNLTDMLGLYGIYLEGHQIKNYAKLEGEVTVKLCNAVESKNGGEEKMTIEELQAELEKERAKNKKYTKAEGEKDQKIADLEKKLKDQKEANLASEKAAEKAKVKEYITGLKAEKLATPSMERHLEELLIEPEKKEYTLGEDKKGSKQDSLKEMLTIFAEAVKANFTEKTETDKKKEPKKSEVAKREEEIEAYAKENKCNYTDAYKAVMKKYADREDFEEEEDEE